MLLMSVAANGKVTTNANLRGTADNREVGTGRSETFSVTVSL